MSKILITVPIRDLFGSVKPKTESSIARMRQQTGHATELFMARGQQISQNSFHICQEVMEKGWDYMLYTGDDIVFPPYALDRLLGHNKDFVSAVCTWKSPPYMVPAGKVDENDRFRHILIRPEHVINNVLMEVDGVGSGFILVHRRVIEGIWDYLNTKVYPSIPKEYRWMSPLPFFPVTRDPDRGEIIGSDFAFARLAKAAGFDIFLDCGLICRHRWEGEYDITDHWEWLDRYGFTREEEKFYGDNPGYTPADEDSIWWGELGPPVPVTMTTVGNHYHLQEHTGPVLGGVFEPIEATGQPRTETGYIIGFHIGDDASWKAHANWCSRFKKVVVQWCGTDILNIDNWMNEDRLAHLNHPRFIHVVESERLLPEIQQYFEKSYVLTMPVRPEYEVTPLPDKFAVMIYYPKHRHEFHYGDVVQEVIRRMPDVRFNLCHLYGGKPDFEYPNMKWYGALSPPEYTKVLGMSSCMVRLSQHDGHAYSIREAAMMGRRFVTNFDMPGTHKVPDVPTADDVIEQINKIREEVEPDKDTSEIYKKANNHLAFKKRFRELAGIKQGEDFAEASDS